MSEQTEIVPKGGLSEPSSHTTLVLIASPIGARRRSWSKALHGRFATVEVPKRVGLRQMLTCLRPTVLLLDGSARGLVQSPAIIGLQRLSPQTRILTALERADIQMELSLLLSGVRGCCSTSIPAPVLLDAVESVARGEFWIRRCVLEIVVESLVSVSDTCKQEHLTGELSRMLDLLTPRQREIVQLVGRGDSNKQIAQRLSLSEKTVKAHLTSAFQKLGISDRLSLALLVNHPSSSSSYVPLPFTQAARDPKRLSFWLKR